MIPRMGCVRLKGLFLLVFWMLTAVSLVEAQDVVFTKTDKGNEISRKGLIVDWVGDSLTLEVGGRNRQLKNESILRIETAWSESYRQAESLFEERKFRGALEMYQAALNTESRDWAQNMILSRMVQCGNLLEEHALAGACFARIARRDPRSRFIHLIPLPWLRNRTEASAEVNAQGWLQSNNATIKLLGASWLLGGTSRADAQAALEELGLGADPYVAHLAKLQLWKSKVVTAKENEMGRLQAQIERMPKSIQAPALLILSDVQSRLDMQEESILTLMRIPILHSGNLKLSAVALQKSAVKLAQSGQTRQASRLYREILRDFAETAYAIDATAQLQSLEGKQ